MMRKRKRSLESDITSPCNFKRRRTDIPRPSANSSFLGQSVLQCYYPKLCTLRQYILSCLVSQPQRRRRVARITSRCPDAQPLKVSEDSAAGQINSLAPGGTRQELRHKLSKLLDTTIVGHAGTNEPSQDHGTLHKDFVDFTQRSSSTAGSSSLGEDVTSQSDLVDFVVWRLFNRTYRNVSKPPHMLCRGFQRSDAPRCTAEERAPGTGIHGLMSMFPNSYIGALKGEVWSYLLKLLGKDGDQIMLNLLLGCGLFAPLEIGRDNLYQFCGVSLAELPVLATAGPSLPLQSPLQTKVSGGYNLKPSKIAIRTPAAISFVRSRMLYARPALNTRGYVRLGMRHIHALNRYPDPSNAEHTTHLMKYVFPRQFGLHNVFTSTVDKRETSHPFKDYTMREQEIEVWLRRQSRGVEGSPPKRLRGECFGLVQKMQRLHSNCSYIELLKHYCPTHVPPTRMEKDPKTARTRHKSGRKIPTTQQTSDMSRDGKDVVEGGPKQNLVDMSTPIARVSAFCRAVMANLLPQGFLGEGLEGTHNVHTLMQSVKHFVECKRFENLTLKSVCENIKISHINWLRPPNVEALTKMSQSDFSKRKELLQEIIYYIFDSILIPLIRSNFHVTESNDHKYRLFYFRHDVWRRLTEPAISSIKSTMFQEIPANRVAETLKKSLGYSHIRLLPKRETVRPITNLRRRMTVVRNGKVELGQGINSKLRNVFGMLNFEKSRDLSLLGSSLFSMNELYPRVRQFQAQLVAKGEMPKLYFVKVDVQSCFDTIPQDAVLALLEKICSLPEYSVTHHAEIKSAPGAKALQGFSGAHAAKPSRKFVAPAHDPKAGAGFAERVDGRLGNGQGTAAGLNSGKRSTVFVEGSAQARIEGDQLLDLLDDHIKRNIVRIGKKYYRQKEGIPQGSVLSSLLCSFFYGDFERKELVFLRKGPESRESILLRLIDDFLLVTTSKSKAERFLDLMLVGNQKYGIRVKPEKTLINFNPTNSASSPCSQHRHQLQTLPSSTTLFPYCGIVLDTRTLELSKDFQRLKPLPKAVVNSSLGNLRLHKHDRNGLNLPAFRPTITDSLAIEHEKKPGLAFWRKMMNTFKANAGHAMFTDTNLNSRETVLRGMFAAFEDGARKMLGYVEVLRRTRARSENRAGTSGEDRMRGLGMRTELIKKTIRDVAGLAFVLGKSRRENDKETGTQEKRSVKAYDCSLSRAQIEWLAATAFTRALRKKQTLHKDLLVWLHEWDLGLRLSASDRRWFRVVVG